MGTQRVANCHVASKRDYGSWVCRAVSLGMRERVSNCHNATSRYAACRLACGSYLEKARDWSQPRLALIVHSPCVGAARRDALVDLLTRSTYELSRQTVAHSIVS